MEECHDVLQAGRGRQAKAGKAPLFTDRDAVQQCCELYSVEVQSGDVRHFTAHHY